MAVQQMQLYNTFVLDMQNRTAADAIDLANDDIKVALFLSTSNCADLTQTLFGALTNEVATANGYTQDGISVTSQTAVIVDTNTLRFNSDGVVWTAAGGSITARFAVFYSDTPANKSLIGVFLLDDTPADVTVTDTNTLTIEPSATGWLNNLTVNA